MSCGKLELASKMLADNMATLHQLELPHCPGFHAYPCGDHWHTGHTKVGGRAVCITRHTDYNRGVRRDAGTLQQ